MTKTELIQALMAGKKMTSREFSVPDEYYCVYDATYSNPFRFISDDDNRPMNSTWNYTAWREVKEPESPEPKDGESWWYVNMNGDICKSETWNHESDIAIVKQGRVFRTENEAKKFSEWEQAACRLKNRIWELNGKHHRGFLSGEYNYYAVYNTENDSALEVSYTLTYKAFPSWFYLDSLELAEQLVDEMSKDLITYLRY